MKLKIVLILTIFLLFVIKLSCQDIHFSQIVFSPSNLNPALVGANYNNLGSIIYKNQWQSISSPYRTIYGSYSQRITSIKKQQTSNGFWGAGIGFYSDKAGDSNMGTTSGNISFAYHIKINKKSTLGASIQPIFASRSINPTNVKWGTQYETGVGYNSNINSNENIAPQSFNYLDLGAGVLYTYKSSERYMTANDKRSLNIGLALYHISSPRYNFTNNTNDKLNRRYTGFINGQFGIQNSNISLLPGLYYNHQGNQNEVLFGTYFQYLLKAESHYTGMFKGSSVSFGTFLRAKDAIVLKMMLNYQQYSFGFAYDLNISNLDRATQARGGIEIAICFMSPNPFGNGTSVKFN